MPPRIPSPFKPGRTALVEPIQQPLYSSVEVGTTPAADYTFFQNPRGATGQNLVYTNLETAGNLSSPKIFVIRGLRLHFAQNVAIEAENVQPTDDLVDIIESYTYILHIGTKDYLEVPAFYCSSGLGLWFSAAAAGAEAANQVWSVSGMGVPHHENYVKMRRRPIVIPPQQAFNAQIKKGPALASINAARRVWNFLEGDLGREVQ